MFRIRQLKDFDKGNHKLYIKVTFFYIILLQTQRILKNQKKIILPL